MKEALDGFLYSLPDLGFAGFRPPATSSREDHIRGNEIKELTGTDSCIHFAQSSSCDLFIEVTSKRGTHSLTAVFAQALYQFGKALPFHHHHALKGNGIFREDAVEEQFTECGQSLIRRFMGEQDGGKFACNHPGPADHDRPEQIVFSGEVTVKRFLRGTGIARDFAHAGGLETPFHKEFAGSVEQPVGHPFRTNFRLRAGGLDLGGTYSCHGAKVPFFFVSFFQPAESIIYPYRTLRFVSYFFSIGRFNSAR